MNQQEVLDYIEKNMQKTNDDIQYMTYKGYIGTIQTHPDDYILCGRVLLTRDLMCYTGINREALADAFQSMVDEYIYDLTVTFGEI